MIKRTFLVTGSNGFVGQRVVSQLARVEPGIRVVCADNETYAGRTPIQDECVHAYYRGDVSDPGVIDAVFSHHRIDCVIHLAAETHVLRSNENSSVFYRTNVLGTRTVITRAIGARARFVCVSTQETLGPIGQDRPSNLYAATKRLAELITAEHFRRGGDVIITRSTNNFGRGQHGEKLLPSVLAASHGQPLRVFGNGKARRRWIHVDDHASGIVRAALYGHRGGVYHFPGVEELSITEVIGQAERALQREIPKVHVPTPVGYSDRYELPQSSQYALPGWTPRTLSFDSGLRQILE